MLSECVELRFLLVTPFHSTVFHQESCSLEVVLPSTGEKRAMERRRKKMIRKERRK